MPSWIQSPAAQYRNTEVAQLSAGAGLISAVAVTRSTFSGRDTCAKVLALASMSSAPSASLTELPVAASTFHPYRLLKDEWKGTVGASWEPIPREAIKR